MQTRAKSVSGLLPTSYTIQLCSKRFEKEIHSCHFAPGDQRAVPSRSVSIVRRIIQRDPSSDHKTPPRPRNVDATTTVGNKTLNRRLRKFSSPTRQLHYNADIFGSGRLHLQPFPLPRQQASTQKPLLLSPGGGGLTHLFRPIRCEKGDLGAFGRHLDAVRVGRGEQRGGHSGV